MSIAYFVLVWSLFDFRYLDSRGRLADVEQFIKDHISDEVDAQEFQPVFEYFQKRYLDIRSPNHRLDELCWNDYQTHEKLAKNLSELDPSPSIVIGALLRITYRLRCNLIHGSKWNFGLVDQLENFAKSNKVMTMIMDRFG